MAPIQAALSVPVHLSMKSARLPSPSLSCAVHQRPELFPPGATSHVDTSSEHLAPTAPVVSMSTYFFGPSCMPDGWNLAIPPPLEDRKCINGTVLAHAGLGTLSENKQKHTQKKVTIRRWKRDVQATQHGRRYKEKLVYVPGKR